MKKNNNVFRIGLNSFFTDMGSEMIKPLLPIYLKVVLQTPVWLISLFNTLSEFLANVFKIIFGIYSDKNKDKKKLILLGYSVSNLIKPLMFIVQSVYWLFFVELFNRIGKGIRSAPKEVLMTYSIEENKLGKGFGFQKAMDSFGAFTGTLLISLILYIFGLEYTINIAGITINLFFIIMLLTLIPGVISYQIIVKKVRNVYIDEKFMKEVEEKKKKKIMFDFSKIYSLGKKFNSLMLYTFLLSIGNVALVFFILELLNKDFLAYQITLFYSVYTLVDALFSYEIGKLSDKKGYNKYILFSSLLFIFIALLLTFIFGIDKSLFGVIIGIIVFGLLGLYEAAFEGTFKKVIVENIEKENTGTAMGLHMGISGITKIIVSLVFSYAWSVGKTDIVFGFGFLFIFISTCYLYYIYKSKKITI